mmetsp:Transcript_84942/g.218808  ORF Transcript_84942/g.218808 Transcript_84942/m.218808 type:complete len:229 (+) Transcript_84942:74-760(+)
MVHFAFALLAKALCALGGLCAAVWSWGSFLDKHEHEPAHVRASMFLVVVLVTSTELILALSGVVAPWVVLVSLTANIWGSLDAVLRFPAAHEVESFFSIKQFVLLLIKTFAFLRGFESVKMHVMKAICVLIFNTWCLPVLYLMALPLDACENVHSNDENDVDLLRKLWQLVFHGPERRQAIATCRKWWFSKLLNASEYRSLAPLAVQISACHASGAYQRNIMRQGRSV